MILVLWIAYTCPRLLAWTVPPAARPVAAALNLCQARPERATAAGVDDALAQAAKVGQAAAPRLFDEAGREISIEWTSTPRLGR